MLLLTLWGFVSCLRKKEAEKRALALYFLVKGVFLTWKVMDQSNTRKASYILFFNFVIQTMIIDWFLWSFWQFRETLNNKYTCSSNLTPFPPFVFYKWTLNVKNGCYLTLCGSAAYLGETWMPWNNDFETVDMRIDNANTILGIDPNKLQHPRIFPNVKLYFSVLEYK